MSEDLGLNKGMNDAVPLSTLGAPGEEEWCRKIVNLAVAWLSLRGLTRHPRGMLRSQLDK